MRNLPKSEPDLPDCRHEAMRDLVRARLDEAAAESSRDAGLAGGGRGIRTLGPP